VRREQALREDGRRGIASVSVVAGIRATGARVERSVRMSWFLPVQTEDADRSLFQEVDSAASILR
jgi:hypothetical protein